MRIDPAHLDATDTSFVHIDQEVSGLRQLALEARQRIAPRTHVAHHASERRPQALPEQAAAHLAVVDAREPRAGRQRGRTVASPGIAHFPPARLDLAARRHLEQPVEDVLRAELGEAAHLHGADLRVLGQRDVQRRRLTGQASNPGLDRGEEPGLREPGDESNRFFPRERK